MVSPAMSNDAGLSWPVCNPFAPPVVPHNSGCSFGNTKLAHM